MVHEHCPQGWLGMADQPGCLCVPRCLPSCNAQVDGGTQRRAGQHSPREREAEPGHGGPARGGVGGTQPQHARPDQVAQPPAEGGGMDREGQPGQSEGRHDRPAGGEVDDNGQQRCPGCPLCPAEHPGAQRAGAGRVGQQHRGNGHRASPASGPRSASSSASRSSAASCGLIWRAKCASAVRRSVLVPSASFISAAVYPDREPVGS